MSIQRINKRESEIIIVFDGALPRQKHQSGEAGASPRADHARLVSRKPRAISASSSIAKRVSQWKKEYARPGKDRCRPSCIGTSVGMLVVPPKFSAAIKRPRPFAARRMPRPSRSRTVFPPPPSRKLSADAAFFSVGRAQRYCVPFAAGVPYLWLWGFTMLRQSRSPRRRPWISTSAVATLEAKGML